MYVVLKCLYVAECCARFAHLCSLNGDQPQTSRPALGGTHTTSFNCLWQIIKCCTRSAAFEMLSGC